MRVAFIGLGRMGFPMAEHLLDAGHELTVFNRTAVKAAPLVAAGAQIAASPASAAGAAAVVVTCVTDPPAVEAVYSGDHGILSAPIEGRLLIDHSTIDPELARRLARLAAEKGAAFLDAPVSGGVAGAQAGSLTVMVGGDEEPFRRAQPILRCYAAAITHMGPSGAGVVTKLANQLLVAVHSAAAAEALVLAARAGIDIALVLKVLAKSFGASRMLERNGALTLDRSFDGGTSIDLIAKDLRLIGALGRNEGVPLPLAEQAAERFDLARADDLGPLDLAAIVLPLERTAGIQVGARKEASHGRGD